MGFQQSVNRQPAPAIEGDFASADPRASMLAGEGILIAGAAGLIVGRFGFARNDNGKVDNADPGVPYRIGFVHRDQPVLITGWLAGQGMTVQPGLEVTLHDAGAFWARFPLGAAMSSNAAPIKVFASLTDGTARAGAPGANIAGYIETPWYVASLAAAGELAKIQTRGAN